jgi:imidazole glycerol-phosphate synthase subunit HisH
MLFLIDYHAGNLTSVKKAFAAIGVPVRVPEHPDELIEASGIVVPGVGHFGATKAIDGRWTEAILDRVSCGRPLLGICVGMQWLYESSTEAPDVPGVGLMSGVCSRLVPGPSRRAEALRHDGVDALRHELRVKVPHVGWNALEIVRESWITEGVEDGAQVYFTHSYAAPPTADAVATTEHAQRFTAVVQRGCVAGVQFHPEKSGDVGLRIIRNFARLCA